MQAPCSTWEWGGRLQPSFTEPKTLCLSDARGSAVAWRLVRGMLPLERMGGSCAVSWIVRCAFWGHRLQSPNCGSVGQDCKKITSHILRIRFSRHVLPLVAPCVGDFSTFDKKRLCSLSSWTQTWPHHPNSNLICLPVLSLLQPHPADGEQVHCDVGDPEGTLKCHSQPRKVLPVPLAGGLACRVKVGVDRAAPGLWVRFPASSTYSPASTFSWAQPRKTLRAAGAVTCWYFAL